MSRSATPMFKLETENIYYRNFINSIRAETTKKSYQHYLKKYIDYSGDIICNRDIKDILGGCIKTIAENGGRHP